MKFNVHHFYGEPITDWNGNPRKHTVFQVLEAIKFDSEVKGIESEIEMLYAVVAKLIEETLGTEERVVKFFRELTSLEVVPAEEK